MRTESSGATTFRIEFDSPAELAAVERASLGVGGLLLPRTDPAPTLPPDTRLTLTLQVAGGPEVAAAARVVAALPGAVALHLEGNPAELIRALLAPGLPGGAAAGTPAAVAAVASADAAEAAADPTASGSAWEQLRRMTPPQKVLLAPRANRQTRALLVQESDPQVLFALLKNPRLTTDELLRVAKSSFLSFQAAELILKTNPWFANVDVRIALIRNPKLPTPFALRILPTLPDSEVRAIAKGAAPSMALKQAALKRLHPT